jgi:cobalt-zinc-cadmium efflux system protein
MLAIAAGGLGVNLLGLAILNAGKKQNLNLRGAWLHVLSDALGSVGAIAAGFCIWIWGWSWADPAASILIALLIIHSSWSLLREVVGVLMEWAPPHIDVGEVQASIAGLSGVVAVHDLHVWTITSGMVSLSGHVVAVDGHRGDDLLRQIGDVLRDRFDITHTTIQIEPRDFEEPGAVCTP